jgi:hypothetical protein
MSTSISANTEVTSENPLGISATDLWVHERYSGKEDELAAEMDDAYSSWHGRTISAARLGQLERFNAAMVCQIPLRVHSTFF